MNSTKHETDVMDETSETNAASAGVAPEPRLAVIIPTHNRWEEARVCLAALERSIYRNFMLVLVEDGCTDGTVERCAEEFPDVRVLHGDGNLWWSGAINMGLEYALRERFDAVVWLNDDNRVEPQTLGELVESHRRQGARSVVCARICLIGESGGEWLGQPPVWHRDFKTWRDPEMSGVDDVPLQHPPGGQGVLIPADCFREVGVVDARAFPHYWADHDFHYRAMRAGFRYFVAVRAVVNNVPNKPRPQHGKIFTLAGAFWFLFNRRSALNMVILHRLLKRHLPPREYRATFYPLLGRHLQWLASGWAASVPVVHRSLRTIKRNLISGRRA